MKGKKQRRERIPYERATERAAERTFLSPTFAAIQLKRLGKSVVLARASLYSRKVSLLRELAKRRRRRKKKEEVEVLLRRVVIGRRRCSRRYRLTFTSSMATVCLPIDERNIRERNLTTTSLTIAFLYAFNIVIPFQPVIQCFCLAD